MATSKIIEDYKASPTTEIDIPNRYSYGSNGSGHSKSPTELNSNLSGSFSKSPPTDNISGSYGKSPSEILKRGRATSQSNKISPFLNTPSPKSIDGDSQKLRNSIDLDSEIKIRKSIEVTKNDQEIQSHDKDQNKKEESIDTIDLDLCDNID